MTIERTELLIGSSWREPASKDTLEVRSPHDQHLVAVLPRSTNADVDAAVDAAAASLNGTWGATTPKERADLIRQIAAGMQDRAVEIAAAATEEMGCPSKFALIGHAFSPSIVLEGFASIVESFPFEETRPGVVGSVLIQKVPVGVAAGIVPWNVPLFIAAMKLGAALAAGTPIVLKPSPEAPLTSFLLGDLLVDVGLPEGAVSILPGDADLGRHLVAHPRVDKVSFTGSTAAGRSVGATCGGLVKRCTLELGGKSAAIVLDDADLATTLPQLLDAGLQNNGQVCAAQTRILVPREAHDQIVDAIVEHLRGLIVGDPSQPETDIGPVVSERQRGRIEGYIASGKQGSARLAFGGGRPAGLDAGFYVEPTLFADVDNSSNIAQEEIFGPVLAVIPYTDVDDAIALANDSEFGLSGSVWTTDTDRGIAVASRIRTGTCAINSGIVVEPKNPFGGFKQSGIGREMGPEGVASYLESRTVVLPA